MSIKQTALNAYFSNRPDEKKLAEKLDEAFDITFGQKHGDKVAFWLADPKDHTKERFGLQQEVLVLYSPYLTTDARVLTAIENVTRNPDFKHRVDKVLFILVHNGDIDSTREIVRSDLDRVIVPFHTDELNNPQRGSLFIRTRIAEEFGEIDLFGMSSPITSDRYFFGREKLVQELVVRATTQAQNSGLFGLRKTGKTSVLRALERRVEHQTVLTEYIDCHNPGIHAARWWQVLENITERLQRKLATNFKRNARLSLDYSSENCGTRFSSDVQALLTQGGLSRIVLLLDEIEYITPSLSGALGKHWDQDFLPFWQTIRATHQETQGQLLFVVAGVNPASVEKTSFDSLPNPIFQLAPPTYLEPFDRGSVRQMVRTLGRYAGVRFDENVYDYITEQFGGHPFLVRIACSEVWQSKNKNDPQELIRVDVNDFRRSMNVIRERLAQPIRDILLSLVWWYPEEYELLQMLAEGEEDFVNKYISQGEGSLFKFAKYGILREGTATEFAIDDLREFIRSNGERYKNEISPFTRGDMPPELLPEIPDLEVLGRLFDKRVEMETKLRRAIVFYLGVHRNWDIARIAKDIIQGLRKGKDRPDPAALFVGRSPQEAMAELYLLDLKGVILASWDVFKGLFDNQKDRFNMNMDTINLARRADAHTKPLTEGQITDFNNSYGWIKRYLDRVPNL